MASSYNRNINGIKMVITPHPKGFQWGVEIAGGYASFRPQIYKGVNYDNKPFWRLRPNSLPGAFYEQFHGSLNDALKTIARLYREYEKGI